MWTIEMESSKTMRSKISTLPSLRAKRRNLRKNSTPQEIILWSRLRNKHLGVKFRRQHSFENYIADFYCPEKSLVVEIDGSQHLAQERYDDERTKFFESLGLRVERFWNNEINTNINGVVERITGMLAEKHPFSNSPPLKRGRG